MSKRFSPGLAAIALLLSLLGSLLAPGPLRIQPYPGLFPGPAAPGLGLPFAEPLWPLTGALLGGLLVGLALRRVAGAPTAFLGSSALLIWGMLWGGGLTERGLVATLLIGLLAAVSLLTLQVQGGRWWPLLLVLPPHGLFLLFLLLQGGLRSPLGLMLGLALVHGALAGRGASTRPLVVALFLLQSALFVLGSALFPLLPS